MHLARFSLLGIVELNVLEACFFMNKRIAVLVSAAVLALCGPTWAEEAPPATAEPLFAIVNDKPITVKEFHAAFTNYLREKFYHGQVPENQLVEAQKATADRLIDRILLLDEAKRRGLVADQAKIDQTIAGYDARYASSETWQKSRERMLPGLRQQLVDQDLLRQMETLGRAIPEPSEDAVRQYFAAHPDLFTEPEKLRLHTIVLKVDPSAPKAAWDAAREEAKRHVARARNGEATFEDLATLHSQDRSADQGGDMGYIHKGMIPESVQSQLDANPMGKVGDPIDVLEGIAIFRLDERIPAKLMKFEDVASRARELLKREQTTQAWEKFIATLRQASTIKMANGPAAAPAKQ